MQQPKPPSQDLTAKGTPRKNAPGAGRPYTGREQVGPRISAATKARLQTMAAHWHCSEAEALERAVELAAGTLPRKRQK